MNQHENSDTSRTSGTATVSRIYDKPIGVCIFLTVAELQELDVEPAQINAIQYSIKRMDEKSALNITASTESAFADVQDAITD